MLLVEIVRLDSSYFGDGFANLKLSLSDVAGQTVHCPEFMAFCRRDYPPEALIRRFRRQRVANRGIRYCLLHAPL